MKKIIASNGYVFIIGFLAFISIILFSWNEIEICSGFQKLSTIETINSDKFSDFGSFFGGFIGTIVASLGFWYVLKSYSHQIFQQDLETITKIIEQLRKLADKIDFDSGSISLQREVHRDHKVKTEAEIQGKKSEYFNWLKRYYVSGYSIGEPTPRVDNKFSHFFRLFESVVELIQSIQNETDKKKVKTLFLATFSDSEIKMISYYYYLFRDKIFPNTKSVVKESEILEGHVFRDLKFSDDFLHNFDPRLAKNHFNKQVDNWKIPDRD